MAGDDLHSVETFVAYGDEFYGKHVERLGHTKATMGGLWMGMARAVLECPNCPGCFRRPLRGYEDTWDKLGCPNCGGLWVRKEPEPEPTKKARKTRAKRAAEVTA